MKILLGLSAEDLDTRLGPQLSGVGLVRGEYILRRAQQYVTRESAQAKIYEYLTHVAALFAPDDVWYRTSDLESEEVLVLAGCDDIELNDRAGLYGIRGVRRARRYPDTFDKELEAFARAAAEYPNLGLLFPFVTQADELSWAIERARRLGIACKFGSMLETPAAVMCAAEFVDTGISRCLIGSNDLWSFTMAAQRGSEAYPRDALGLQRMIQHARAMTRGRCELGLAGYLTPELIAFARQAGLDDATIHYSDLSKLLGTEFERLPEQHRMRDIKRWTRQAIAERRVRLHSSGT